MSKTTGIEARHARSCRTRDDKDARCNCTPSYQANVWSRRESKRIRKTFGSLDEARSWRVDAMQALRKGTMRAPTATTLRVECDAWLAGAERGEIRTRAGKPYKPSVVRSYRTSLDIRRSRSRSTATDT